MKLVTKHFGEIDIDESKVISFSNGIPGFPQNKKFIILSNPEESNNMFHWMQSIDDGETAFVVFDTFRVMPEYDPLVNMAELEELGEFEKEDLLIYNVAVVPSDVTKTTINLKAPVVINTKNNLGKQVIVNNDEYAIRHYVFDDTNKEGR